MSTNRLENRSDLAIDSCKSETLLLSMQLLTTVRQLQQQQKDSPMPLTVDLARKMRDTAGHGKNGVITSSGTSVQQISTAAISPGTDAAWTDVKNWKRYLQYVIAGTKVSVP